VAPAASVPLSAYPRSGATRRSLPREGEAEALERARFGDLTPEELAELRDLDLTGLEITDAALDHLWDLPALEHLEPGATSPSEAAVRRFMDAHPDWCVHSRWSR